MTALPEKETVRAVATSNITLSGTQTVDGVALAAGERCLVAGQTTAANNGLYRVAAGAWTRTYDAFSSGIMFPGHTVHVSEGTLYANSKWACTTTGVINLGTTALTYTRVWPGYKDSRSNAWDVGALGDTVPRTLCSAFFTQTSGTVYLYGGLVLSAGVKYTNVNVYFNTAGTVVTHTWAGVAAASAIGPYSARQLLAVSADNTAAPTVQAIRTFAFTSTFTPTVDVPVWMVLCLAATTVPQLVAAPVVVGTLTALTPVLVGTSNTAQTTPIAVNTVLTAPTATSQVAYGYLT